MPKFLPWHVFNSSQIGFSPTKRGGSEHGLWSRIRVLGTSPAASPPAGISVKQAACSLCASVCFSEQGGVMIVAASVAADVAHPYNARRSDVQGVCVAHSSLHSWAQADLPTLTFWPTLSTKLCLSRPNLRGVAWASLCWTVPKTRAPSYM